MLNATRRISLGDNQFIVSTVGNHLLVNFAADMINERNDRARRQVAAWLLLGAAMIVIQVLLGGITRLTESGLSITEWKPITGALPPLNHADWQLEFDKYKGTDQFKYVHQDFSLSDFKFIFFWEWMHRQWARLMGLVFLVGFTYFIATRKFKKEMVTPMVILFLLGALQGAIGWLMVKSGLVPEKYFVGHIELTTHLVAALLLLCYTLWFALKLKIKTHQLVYNAASKNLLVVIAIVLFFQLIYGGFMAGLKAGEVAPTWPGINGSFFPATIGNLSPGIKNLFYNTVTIHFVHRFLAFLLLVLIVYGWFKARMIKGSAIFNRLWLVTIFLTGIQVLLGILTVLNATYPDRLVWLGVCHQFNGMLVVIVITCLFFVTRKGTEKLIKTNYNP